MLVIEQFLMSNYRFRRNILNGKVEFAILPEADNKAEGNTVEAFDSLSNASDEEANLEFRPLTQAALNSIVIRAKREQIMEKGSPKTEITEYVQSEEVPEHNPVQVFLKGLPVWDGQNHIAKVFGRIPGLSSEQLNFLTIWLRSAVAHWLGMDMLHGNECVPTLIGPQGCGKTTFLRRLLPQHLREYYLDHLNLSNKCDKEMALTNNLLVNLDELDAIRPSQHAELKQTLSKSKVNGRPIYGTAQEDRPRYASFVATTNNPHPLTDPTGSRRYICLRIPEGLHINNAGNIDYAQLYAQVLHELRTDKAPYWFSNDEVARIQELNAEYLTKVDMTEMVEACFRKPMPDEKVKPLNSTEMLKIIQHDYTTLVINHKATIHLGNAMKALGYKSKEPHHVHYYYAVPLHKTMWGE
jgi:predicted P-loop ATPase